MPEALALKVQRAAMLANLLLGRGGKLGHGLHIRGGSHFLWRCGLHAHMRNTGAEHTNLGCCGLREINNPPVAIWPTVIHRHHNGTPGFFGGYAQFAAKGGCGVGCGQAVLVKPCARGGAPQVLAGAIPACHAFLRDITTGNGVSVGYILRITRCKGLMHGFGPCSTTLCIRRSRMG